MLLAALGMEVANCVMIFKKKSYANSNNQYFIWDKFCRLTSGGAFVSTMPGKPSRGLKLTQKALILEPANQKVEPFL